MKKRIISLLLAAAMLVTLMPAAFAAGTYSDTDGHWGEAAIDRWSSYGVIGGYDGNVFVPDGSMTRAEVARVFVNLLGLERRTDISKYKDVAPSAWYYDDIAKCVAAGILNGDGVAAMNPETPVTREELFTMFARALGVAPKATANKQFIDGNEVSSWAAGYVNALADMGVINGYGGVLSPGSDINRASVMTVLDNAIKTYVTTNGATVGAGDGIVLVVADNVTVTGKVENLVVADSGKTVTVNGGAVDSVTVVGPQDKVIFTGAAAADTVTIPATAEGASVVVNSAAVVGSVVSEADNVTISGAGKVETAAVSGDNTTVNTDGTDLTVAPGTTGVTENSKPVTGGTTVETEPVQNQGTTTPVTPPVYVPTYYTVTFVNGEENTTQSVVAGGTATKPADPTTTENCKEFSGWYVDNATASYDFTAAVTGNLTLTAMWVDSHDYKEQNIMAADNDQTAVGTQQVCSGCGDVKDVVLNGSAVAQVGDTYYVSLAEAIKAAEEKQTVTLLANVAYDGGINVSKDLTLDLNENVVTSSKVFHCGRTDGSKNVPVSVTIKNGTWIFESTANSGRVRFENGCTGTFENMTFKSSGTTMKQMLQVYADAADGTNTYTFNNCIFENTYAGFEGGSGKSYLYNITFTKCTFNGTPGNGGGFIELGSYSYGTALVEDCKFTLTTENNSPAAIRCNGYQSYTGNEKMVVTIKDSSFEMTSYYQKFYGGWKLPTAVFFLPASNGEVKEEGTNTYTVDGVNVGTYDSTLTALIGTTKYLTLEAAMEAAQSGDTVVLMNNCSENITLKPGVTLDSDMRTYSGTVSAPEGYSVSTSTNTWSKTVYTLVEDTVSP